METCKLDSHFFIVIQGKHLCKRELGHQRHKQEGTTNPNVWGAFTALKLLVLCLSRRQHALDVSCTVL